MRRVCPLCGGAAFQKVKFDLCGCLRCGMIVDRKVWTISAEEELESAWFEDGYDLKPNYWNRQFQRLKNLKTWRRLQQHGYRQGRLLEVGVGSGSFLTFARSQGAAVEGCDASQRISAFMNETTGVKVHHCKVQELTHRMYDAIVMNHVIEHVSDPLLVLRNISRLLAPGGILHVAAPNVVAWEAQLSGWNAYEPFHLLYFSPATLSRALAKVGFELLTVATSESFSGWYLGLLRTLFPRNKPSRGVAKSSYKEHPWIEHIYRISTIAAGAVTLPFRALQAKLGYGDEVVIVARRRRD